MEGVNKMSGPVYKRALLKLSGGAMSGKNNILDFDKLSETSRVIKRCVENGTQMSVVIGAGNIWRGRSSGKMDRTRADQMGMAATMINSLALQETLEEAGQKAVVMSAIEMKPFAEIFDKNKAIEYMENGAVVIFACGTGHPYFSTDTAGVLRAVEIGADIALFSKDIDGVYTDDPRINKDAVKLSEITYAEILSKGLKVIDTAAAAIAMDNGLKTLLFAAEDPENVVRVLAGEKLGTIVK
jgi:uridylate kinase